MKEEAIFAMGCFWQPDYIFSKTAGVIKTEVGYAGCNPKIKNPSYEDVCSDKTGCAEAIKITFDSEKISYEKLLDIFWTHHDPTALNHQGPDYGSQYRSAIFCVNEKQSASALKSKEEWRRKLKDKTKEIVTEIVNAKEFYSAEDYHQKYLEKTGRACHIAKNVFE